MGFTAERVTGFNHQRKGVRPDGHLRREPGEIKRGQDAVKIHQQNAGVARVSELNTSHKLCWKVSIPAETEDETIG